MNHPAIDAEAVSRLRRRLNRSTPATSSTDAGSPDEVGQALDQPAGAGAGAGEKAKAVARRVAVPLVARVRHELDRAVTRELATLRTELDQLRKEVARTRSEHAAAIAALQEERQAR